MNYTFLLKQWNAKLPLISKTGHVLSTYLQPKTSIVMELDENNITQEHGGSPEQHNANEPDTLIETLEDLKTKGFTYDFNLTAHSLEIHKDDGVRLSLSPEDFTIVDVFRFEGMSNPSDNSILYAIESCDGLKGTLVSSYGMYSDAMSNEMIKKLDTRSSIIGFNTDDIAH